MLSTTPNERVTRKQNTKLRELVESLREFSQRAPASSVRLLFYASHGLQAKGRNYLMPVDIEPQSEDEIPARCADVGEFIDRLSAIPHGTNIVVLDACRVNPFTGAVIVGPDGRRLKFRGATPGGLATLDAPVGQHSIYAKHFLAQLQTPSLPVEQLFKRVRIGVAEETQRVQVPWESSSLTADFCFRPGSRGQCSA